MSQRSGTPSRSEVAPLDYDSATDVGNVTTFTFEQLVSGVYYFSVQAYDHAGNLGDASEELEVFVP